MNLRIKELRLSLGLKQNVFAEKLGVTAAAISKIESGNRYPSNQIITSICKEWNVNKEWLLTGNGEMFVSLDLAEAAELAVGKALKTQDPFVLSTFLALAKLSPQEWKTINNLVETILETKNKDS